MKRPVVRSRITLSSKDVRLVGALRMRLGLASDLEVVRRALQLLQERGSLQEAYRQASRAARRSTQEAIRDLHPLDDEGID
jgi:hypothetical protein